MTWASAVTIWIDAKETLTRAAETWDCTEIARMRAANAWDRARMTWIDAAETWTRAAEAWDRPEVSWTHVANTWIDGEIA